MGFNMLFYIIFGTNLLTRGLVPVPVFFAYFSVSQKRNIKRNPNETKPSRGSFLEQTQTRRLGVEVWKSARWPRDRRVRPGGRRTPTLMGPTELHRHTSFAYIYSYTLKTSGEPRNHFSTAATFWTREIPSWGLFRRSAGGGIDHGGLLHQHHSLSDDV